MPTSYKDLISQSDITNISQDGPLMRAWGHSLIVDTGGETHSIKCQECEKEESVPGLLEQSSGFRQVVYKLHAFGEFKQSSCGTDTTDLEDIIKDRGIDKGNHPISGTPPHTHRVNLGKHKLNRTSSSGDVVDQYIPEGNKMKIAGDVYTYMGSGYWINPSGDRVSTLSLFDKNEDFMKKAMPPEVVDMKQYELDRVNKLKQNINTSNISTTNTDVNINSDNSVTDSNKSPAEKLAQELSKNQHNYLSSK